MMDIRSHTIPGIVSKFTFSSSSYSGEKGGSSLNFSGDLLSNLIPVSSIHLIDSGIHSLVPGFQNSVLNIDESQSAPDLVGALEKSLLWHDVQAIERATVAPEGAASASLSSSSYHPNYNVSLPHHTTAVGSSGHYDSISNLDLTKFEHTDSDNVSVFYEAAVDGAFAEAADLPKEIPPLGYFPFDNLGFNGLASDHVDLSAGRITTFSEPVEVVTPSAPELLPPIADPNDYSFSASTFIEAETSESPVFASVALQASQIFHFDLGNILTDPQNLTLPVSVSNLVDSDPDGTLLLINSTSNPALTIAGVAIDLAPVTGSLPAGEVAEYEFTYQGNVGVLIISQDGTLSLETAATNLFGPLTPAQAALFSFDYNDRDADGLTSNTAHVTINILGINDPPTAIDDFNQVQEVITDSGGNEGEGGEGENTLLLASSALTLNGADPRTIATGNILANDTDPDGSFAAGDFSVVSVTGHTFNNANGTWTFTISDEAGGDEGSISGWQLTLQTDTNTYVFNNPTVLTILDNTTVSSDITVSGVVGAITHVSLTLVDFQHTFFGDLVGTLEGSNGQSVNLFNRDGGGNDINGNVTLDDNAGSSISGAPEPISGTFQTSSGTALNDFTSSFPTTLVVHGLYGDFTIHQDGTYTYQLDTANPDVIQLGTDQTLEDSVPYTMQDSDGLTSSAILHVEILGTPNDPPIAQPNTYETDVDTIAPFVSGGYFVGNIRDDAGPLTDSDPDGNSFSVNSVINPILTIAGVDMSLTPVLTSVPGSVAAYDFDYNGHTGTFTINENGAVILTSSSGSIFLSELPVGQDLVFSFDYTDQDIRLAVSNTAHVDFTVHGDNDPPVAEPNSYVFDASTFSFDEGEASNSSSAFDFSLGNIVTDPVDSSAAPDSVTNPVDFGDI
jgi:VCBS repeat-containing protein